MAKNELAIRTGVSVGALIGIACFVLVGTLSPAISRRVETQSTQPQKAMVLGNRTKSLEIVKAEVSKTGKLVRIAVQNISKKNIDWFRISLGAGSDVEADFAFADKSFLAPGEVYEDEYPFDSKANEIRITIVSLLFEDRASDGDLHYAQLAKDNRSGQQLELSRLLPLLRKANEAAQAQQSAALLQNLETEVSDTTSETRIPSAPSASQTEARLIGVRTARDRVLNEIQRIKTLGSEDKSKALRRLEERHNSIRSKLAGYDF